MIKFIWKDFEQFANQRQHRQSLAQTGTAESARPVAHYIPLKGFEDFDVAFFAEDVYGDACGVAVDDYVAVRAGDA
jgi:hypothetical protein